MLQEGYCDSLADSLHLYAHHLAARERFDAALVHAAEALAVQRRAPTAQQDSGGLSVSWAASGAEHVALSPARTMCRPYKMALKDIFTRIRLDSRRGAPRP